MTDKENAGDRDHLSVRLNEAFERLEKQQEENLASPPPSSRAAGSTRQTAGANRSSVSGVLGVVLSLIAIGIASYAAWNFYIQSNTPSETAQLATGLAGADRRLDDLQSQMNALGKKLDALAANSASADFASKQDVGQLQQRVEESIAQMKASLGTSGSDWLYAEVEYLLRLANERVVMEGNVKGALALFHDADNILRQHQGITAFDLRKAIADNIAQLDAVSELDVDGIFVRLGALVRQVDQLRRTQLRYTPAEPTQSPAAPPAGSSPGRQFMAMLERAGARLARLVDFRRSGERIEPILPPREEYYLRQNLVLKIQMAQLALLRGDQAVYTDSLDEARAWATRHFDPNDPATVAMAKSLAELAAIDVAKKLPDVSSSLKEVRKLMAGFQQQPERAEGEQ